MKIRAWFLARNQALVFVALHIVSVSRDIVAFSYLPMAELYHFGATDIKRVDLDAA